MEKSRDDIQQTENEIYREILEVVADNSHLRAESPELFKSKVIQDMTSLVRIAKEDDAILDFFRLSGKDPCDALDALLQKAIRTLP